jgi:hypothetical protein
MNTILDKSLQLYNTGGPAPYTGQRVAGFTTDQTGAFDQARAGAGLLSAGANDGRQLDAYGGLLKDQMGTATGDPMVNPFSQQIIQQQASDLTDQMNRQFSGFGRIGSYANARAVTDNTGRFLTQAYGDMYDRANARKQQAVGNVMNIASQLPGAYQARAQMNMGAHDALAGIGSQQQQMNQNQINATMALYNEQQQQPWANLNTYENAVLPIAHGGGSTATTSGNQTSPLNTALGLGLGGLSLFSGFGGLGGLGALF